MSTAIQQNMHT